MNKITQNTNNIMNKIFKTWAGFVGEINSAVSERDCKKYSILFASVAIISAIAGKKNKWYFIGSAIYAVLAAAFLKSYKQQRRERWKKEDEEVLNEPVEK